MSRTTQYIGLNDYALDWIKKAGNILVDNYEMTTGMFDEPVMGRIYHLPPPDGPNASLVAREIVQATPWSSGPMIFTHLELTLVKHNGSKVDMGYCFSWMTDPSLAGSEYDRETGRFYV